MEQGSLRCDVNVSLRPSRRRAPGHPLGDQERELAALGGAIRAPRDRPAGSPPGRRGAGRPGDPALARGHRPDHPGPVEGGGGGLPLLPRARPGADRPLAGVGRGPARDAAREPGGEAQQVGRTIGGSARLEMDGVVNAGALDLVEATIAAGADQAAARKWWTGELARIARESGAELAELPITPAQVAAVEDLVVAGTVNDKLARQVIEGVLAGEGSPTEVVAARGLAVVSDDGPLLARDRRGAGGPARRRCEDPGRQGPGRRGDRGCGDEGHPGSGRRAACGADLPAARCRVAPWPQRNARPTSTGGTLRPSTAAQHPAQRPDDSTQAPGCGNDDARQTPQLSDRTTRARPGVEQLRRPRNLDPAPLDNRQRPGRTRPGRSRWSVSPWCSAPRRATPPGTTRPPARPSARRRAGTASRPTRSPSTGRPRSRRPARWRRRRRSPRCPAP